MINNDMYKGIVTIRNLHLRALLDTNHANSGKNCPEQVRIAKEVLHSCRHNSEIKKPVKGFMIESYIEDGA